jgi:hypothetical protein
MFKSSDPILQKYGERASFTGLFDLSEATMHDKLELLEAIIKAQGEGDTFIVVTKKEDAAKLSLAADAVATDVMA